MHLRPIEHVNGINLFEGTNYFKIVMNWKVKRGSLRGKSTVLFTHFWHIRLQDKCSDCTYPWWTLACRPESHARVHFPVKQQDHVPLKKNHENILMLSLFLQTSLSTDKLNQVSLFHPWRCLWQSATVHHLKVPRSTQVSLRPICLPETCCADWQQQMRNK